MTHDTPPKRIWADQDNLTWVEEFPGEAMKDCEAPYILASEVAALIREAEARGMERAASKSETRHQLHLEQVRITNEWIADRDRLVAANSKLEAKVAGLAEAAEDAEYDLLQWLECSKALTAGGFNMDGTAEVTAKLTAALSHIKRGKING